MDITSLLIARKYVDDSLASAIPAPASATVGQTIVVKEVDEEGKPITWTAADFPDSSQNGEDGFSPIATVAQTDTGAVISITDKNGTTTTTVTNGADGTTPHIGENGNWFIGETDTGVSASGGTTSITVDDKLNKESTNPIQNKTVAEAVDRLSEQKVDQKELENYALKDEIPTVPVQSVNGKTGAVQLSASEVGALPNSTKIPANTSDLTNNSGFITKTVTDLANYYLKTEVYTQEEIDNKLSAIPKFAIEVVSTLPTANISETTVYLIASGNEEHNLYTEYIYVDGQWEYLGKQTVDLTNYVKRAELSNYYLKSEMDSLLTTIRNSIPTQLSQFTEDSTHRTVTDTEKKTWNAKSNFSGAYGDLTGKPTIPIKAITSASTAGVQGEICASENWLNICVAENTWKRIPLQAIEND